MRIVVDAMGGDYAPQNIIAGVVDAVKEYDVTITLVGIEDQVKAHLAKYTYPKDRIEIVHAPEVVGMEEANLWTMTQLVISGLMAPAPEVEPPK